MKSTIDLYYSLIRDVPILTRGQEIELFKNTKNSEKARNDFIFANLRLVVKVASQFQGRGLLMDDLISEGNLGLFEAVKKYKLSKGYRFSTYAVWWIRQAITRRLRSSALIRVPDYACSGPRKENAHKICSLSAKVGEFGEIADSIASDVDSMPMVEFNDNLNQILKSELLTGRDRTIIKLSLSKNSSQIGKDIGLTRERVRQLKVLIRKKLKDFKRELVA